MDFAVNVFKEGLLGSMQSIYIIARIIIPLMIVMEVLKELKILDRISYYLEPLTRFLGISRNSAFPIIVGLFLGLAFGAGVIIQSAKEGELSKRDLFLVIVFLIACHSVVEDTLIFVAVGANGWMLLTMRVFTALVLTVAVSKYMDKTTQLCKKSRIKGGI